MTILKWLVIAAIVIYGGLLALMYLFQRALMYFPDPRARRRPRPVCRRPRRYAHHDGEKLIAWYVPPRGGKPLVLYFQGNAGASDLRVDRFTWLTADGTGLLALSYRGYGGSTGKPTEAGSSAMRARPTILPPRASTKRIVLFGESLGTAVAIALAAEREIGALVLDAPFTSAADIGAAAYPFAPVRG